MIKVLLLFSAVLFTILLGYPLAAMMVHGFDPQLWPSDILSPSAWFGFFWPPNLSAIIGTYWSMLLGRAAAFPGGGHSWASVLAVLPLIAVLVWLFAPSRPAKVRDRSNLLGSARFADSSELSRMSRGLELGLDPDTGRAVRVAVEGTLLTIAPPRKGKTSGLLIPNLAVPELSAWAGPAVVVDPKGEVYRATAERRRKLGRRVVCLDPLGLVGGLDRWNPLVGRDAADLLYLQHTALALLPDTAQRDEAAAYFRNRAVDLIAGTMLVALRAPQPSVETVYQLLNSEEKLTTELTALLAAGPNLAASSALEILQADPKTRDPIKSTASQAFQWLADQRLRHLVGASTFRLADLASGGVDLFVAVPPEYRDLLAPFLRWLLSDLFTAIRRNRPKERIVVFIDEAAALGRFDEILTAAGELPGYGASLWTMWQDRSQLVSTYGEAGAAILLNTAEIVTVSDIPAVDPDEGDRWSRAIGNFTAKVETLNRPAAGKGLSTVSTGPQAAPLIPREDLVTMPTTQLLVFPNSTAYPRHPLRLRKTVAYRDPRFARLISAVAPVGTAG